MASITESIKGANPTTKPKCSRKPNPQPPIRALHLFLKDSYDAEKANLEPSLPRPSTNSVSAAISIVMLDNDGNHHAAHINGDAMHYTGSLAKVAALYAAHDLRAAARKHAKDKDNAFTSASDFAKSFEAAIDTSGADPRLFKVVAGRKPKVDRIFAGFKATAPNQVEFRKGTAAAKEFRDFLDDIGENASAGAVIRALGYSYINVSLVKGGFFDPAAGTGKGVWLAGDYSFGGITETVRVPVENDTVKDGSGQAITTAQMSRMFGLLHTGTAFSHVNDEIEKKAANDGAHGILQTEGSFFFGSNATVQISETPLFTKDCAKVGIGSLGPVNPGPSVISEGSVMRWNAATQVAAFNTAKKRKMSGDFALVWQNTYPPNSHWNALIRIVNTSITNFLTQP